VPAPPRPATPPRTPGPLVSRPAARKGGGAGLIAGLGLAAVLGLAVVAGGAWYLFGRKASTPEASPSPGTAHVTETPAPSDSAPVEPGAKTPSEAGPTPGAAATATPRDTATESRPGPRVATRTTTQAPTQTLPSQPTPTTGRRPAATTPISTSAVRGPGGQRAGRISRRSTGQAWRYSARFRQRRALPVTLAGAAIAAPVRTRRRRPITARRGATGTCASWPTRGSSSSTSLSTPTASGAHATASASPPRPTATRPKPCRRARSDAPSWWTTAASCGCATSSRGQ
jgi:hypothetical protein